MPLDHLQYLIVILTNALHVSLRPSTSQSNYTRSGTLDKVQKCGQHFQLETDHTLPIPVLVSTHIPTHLHPNNSIMKSPKLSGNASGCSKSTSKPVPYGFA
ncbi:hypothetical protein INT48_009292 [Thamnidium elegans]|uniref:Uncharacterized protein n=1 Tax=Thamnidium elegans TaxID=101142 RepID=A0A8H7SKC5_9FUNG|nr:hypothetical protein INT48_009292 [Thamnidium elegans]